MISDYQKFIHQSRYARWLDNENRRETWNETVSRYFDFFKISLKQNFGYIIPKEEFDIIKSMVLNLEVMPSMRALMTAGPALERENMAGYNCAYITVDSPRAFDETMYILMNGTGVGFSVEGKYTNILPTISERFENSDTTIVVKDSKEGWSSSYRELINLLYAGQIPKFDISKVRPAGSRLKIFGGRASGSEPLLALFYFTIDTFKKAIGRKLTTLECHDLMCKIAEVVVVGGVRRSALISLSDLNDNLMRGAKTGAWYDYEKQRALANNSAVYEYKPDIGSFIKEWLSLYESKSGERGIFNRQAITNHVSKLGRRDTSFLFGSNPCLEIVLRALQTCNLTEVVIRETDDVIALQKKVWAATVLGTWQSTLTNFGYIRKKWRNNIEEERLLGVSLTGIMDNDLTSGSNGFDKLKKTLIDLRQYAISVNDEYSQRIGINPSLAITCVKPSGTVSQLVDSASGIHTRHSEYYIRTVRADKRDPLTQFLTDVGVPVEDCVMKGDTTSIFSFPIKSPENAVIRTDLTAIEHLKLWKIYQDYWCEHKPSITVSVKESEWLQVGSWVYDNFDEISGVSFLPYADHLYKQAPYQECTKEEYGKILDKMPSNIDWARLSEYEKEDHTAASQALACTGDACEIVDIGNLN